jgi:hypothetical protein
MSEGEIRVTWGDGFANYGMPIPLISQQLTPNLASIINFLFEDVLLSHNIVSLIGAFLSALFYYYFLRIYFTPLIAFTGTFLLNFAPYRIINLYIRGAQPEFFAGVFVPLILIAIYLIIKRKNPYGILLLTFSIALLILTHPFLFVVSALLFVPYIIYLLYNEKQRIQPLLKISASIIFGIGITAYYTLPLFLEVKYFYYGLNKTDLKPNQFLDLSNYLDPYWYYYYKDDVFVRGNFIKAGLLETIITITGALVLIYSFIKRRKDILLLFCILTSLMLGFLSFPQSEFFYQNIKVLSGIQYPWRVLSSLIFITPIILCIILQKIKYQKTLAIIFLIIISILRFPQVYGKNYTLIPQKDYFYTIENLHGNVLNTVWTGKTTEYPVRDQKAEVIEGEGNVKTISMKNSSRKYEIKASSDIRMADYTFYFPGWKVYIDGKEVPIQFQDPNYRGVITYNVPKGEHVVDLRFEHTKPRLIGYGLTIIFLIAAFAFFHAARKGITFYSAFPKALRK